MTELLAVVGAIGIVSFLSFLVASFGYIVAAREVQEIISGKRRADEFWRKRGLR